MISFLKLITLLCILKLTFLLTAAECDLTKCGLPKHYREIGTCEPTKYALDDIEKCCPIEYNCDKIAQQNSAQCHFRNKTYSNGQQLDVYVHCRPSCYCNNNGQFNCAQVSCPETTFDRPEPNCVVQNTRDQCCSTSIICDPQAIEELHVCHMDGKEYRQGQKMFPKSNRCFTCYCDETFNNATEISQNPACLEVDCAIELAYLPRIRSGCVPVYFGEPTCCPISSKCPKEEDQLVRSEGRQSVDETMKCKFGGHELLIGDKVTDKNKCIDCECVIPPMITCVQRRNC